ncbi:MAG TPA: nucleoside-diphosphate kinase [Candidatus Aminicenantes bacterium]|nr:nucleoside-diphosphate kinase [Candidatus Aminicenantes bacterium]
MALEHSLVLIKPDGVELSLTGEVLTHLDREDLFLVGMRAVAVDPPLAAAHYTEHREKPFYQDVIKYLCGGYHSFPWVYAFAFCGEDACAKIRAIVGKTDPMAIDPGRKIVTLRQKYGRNVIVRDEEGRDRIDERGHAMVRFENILHASQREIAEFEIKLWFSPAELLPGFRLYPVRDGEDGRLTWETSARQLLARLWPEAATGRDGPVPSPVSRG